MILHFLGARRSRISKTRRRRQVVGREPTGATRLRRRLLEARGLRVVSIPYYGFDVCLTAAAQEAYVARELGVR